MTEKRNAMSSTVARGLKQRMSAVTDYDEVQCVVVTGAGGAFCAGGDIERMRERIDPGVHVEERAPAEGR